MSKGVYTKTEAGEMFVDFDCEVLVFTDHIIIKYYDRLELDCTIFLIEGAEGYPKELIDKAIKKLENDCLEGIDE